jgi:hypothetical protein
MISTGFKSSVLLVLGNSLLTVHPLTRLTLEEIQNIQGDEVVRLALRAGRVRADVKPPENGKADFTVRTLTATASVRGTSFDFDGVNLSVDEGRVHVSGGNGTAVYVGPGHQAVSSPETGMTTGAVEMVMAELAPAMPAAVAAVTESGTAAGTAALIPRKTASPTAIDVNIKLAQ